MFVRVKVKYPLTTPDQETAKEVEEEFWVESSDLPDGEERMSPKHRPVILWKAAGYRPDQTRIFIAFYVRQSGSTGNLYTPWPLFEAKVHHPFRPCPCRKVVEINYDGDRHGWVERLALKRRVPEGMKRIGLERHKNGLGDDAGETRTFVKIDCPDCKETGFVRIDAPTTVPQPTAL